MIVAGTLRRNTKITSTTSAMASTSSNAASDTDERITPVLSDTTVTCMPAGSVDSSAGNCFLIWFDRGDHVRARLALHVQHDGRRAVVPRAALHVLRGLRSRARHRAGYTGAPF